MADRRRSSSARSRRASPSAAARGGSWSIPAALVALFPVIEWCIHVAILHWKPRSLGPVTDRLAAGPRPPRPPRRPARPAAGLHPVEGAGLAAAGVRRDRLARDADPAAALSLLVSVYAIMFGYEWTHYLVHSDYRPRSRWYRSVWRNHRLHHYKNEHYWFTVTSAGTADRLFGTYPADPARGADLADGQERCTTSRRRRRQAQAANGSWCSQRQPRGRRRVGHHVADPPGARVRHPAVVRRGEGRAAPAEPHPGEQVVPALAQPGGDQAALELHRPGRPARRRRRRRPAADAAAGEVRRVGRQPDQRRRWPRRRPSSASGRPSCRW